MYGEAPVMDAGAKDWTIGEERTGAMMVLILVCAIVLLCRILMFESLIVLERAWCAVICECVSCGLWWLRR